MTIEVQGKIVWIRTATPDGASIIGIDLADPDSDGVLIEAYPPGAEEPAATVLIPHAEVRALAHALLHLLDEG